jgi:hypothetical protein
MLSGGRNVVRVGRSAVPSLMSCLIALNLLVAAGAAALFTTVFRENYQGGRLARAALGRRLAGTRMNAMLRFRGVDPAAYLARTPLRELECDLINCRRCPNTRQCDRVLAGPAQAEPSFSFCPNRKTIAAHRLPRQRSSRPEAAG